MHADKGKSIFCSNFVFIYIQFHLYQLIYMYKIIPFSMAHFSFKTPLFIFYFYQQKTNPRSHPSKSIFLVISLLYHYHPLTVFSLSYLASTSYSIFTKQSPGFSFLAYKAQQARAIVYYLIPCIHTHTITMSFTNKDIVYILNLDVCSKHLMSPQNQMTIATFLDSISYNDALGITNKDILKIIQGHQAMVT